MHSVRCTIPHDFPPHVWYIYFAKRRGLIAEKEVICHYRQTSGIKHKERIYTKILVCEPGKPPYVKDIEHTLENLQAEVDGYIQALYPSETDNIAVVCNEEGLFRDDLAWNRTVEKYGPIKGTFFVCGLGEEDFIGLTDEQIEKYKALFWEPEIFIPTPNGMVVLHIID